MSAGSHRLSPAETLAGHPLKLRAVVARQVVAAVVVYLVLAPGLVALQGAASLATPAIAAMVCLVSAVAAMAAVHPLRHGLDPFQRMSLAVLVRMGIPLIACLWAIQTQTTGPLAGDAFPMYAVLFYLVTLAVEVAAFCGASRQTAAAAKPDSVFPIQKVR